MTTVTQCLRRAEELVESDSARLDVEVLLTHVFNVDRAWLYSWSDRVLDAAQLEQFEALFQRRLNGEPVAYITGEKEFWSLPLAVNFSTLIPRPDTELLIEHALVLPLPENARVLDLGTGTGAIALALASEKPNWQITAVDVSPEAVALAACNARNLEASNVRVLQSDWFDALRGEVFDLILSNPPYISENDEHLNQGDVRFEPATALVSAKQGYADLEKIIEDSGLYLNAGGWLVVEHGFQQGEKITALMRDNGFVEVSLHQDLGGNDRASMGRKNGY
ncbi:MAG: peptide chain release factor N(5)-glutamine methyltransferase [Porticoccaceae bacterium]|nr:peptide chain release factor N(5)-glutamine methyltransferase [Pseudomonadales bacterium]MCP5303201.1 peptide chain release factor N(5)-glutamine methyltransferase [Pseudomonadales bacterium]